jgi:4-amino-4-deoxy-L-arabinose transferase-like glycosyltransferase
MFFKKSLLILTSIVVLALALRLLAIFSTESLWFDEIVSLNIAQLNIFDSWQYLKWENNPPLHYWYLHYWFNFFGENAFVLRLSSVFLSLINIILLYLLGKKVVSQRVGLFASFIYAISSFQIYLASDARMYQLLLLFGLLSLYFFWQLLNNPRRYSWLLYLLFTLLTYYTHLTGLLLLLIENVYFVYHYYFINKKISFTSWFFGQAVIIFLFLPWLISFVMTHLGRLDTTAWYFNTGDSALIFLQIPEGLLLIANIPSILEFVIFFFCFFLLLMSFVNRQGSSFNSQTFKINLNITPAFIFFLIIFLIPVLVSLLTSMWVVKYFSLASLGLYLLLAQGFANLKISFKKELFIIILIFLLFLPVNFKLMAINKHEWQKVTAYLENTEKSGDLIIVGAYVYRLIIDYYYHGQSEIIGFGPNWLDQDDVLLNAIKYNWYSILTTENIPDMDILLKDRQRIIVLNPDRTTPIHRSNILFESLVNLGWLATSEKKFGGFEAPTVIIFERPKCE